MVARKMVKLKVEETSGVDHPAHLQEGWIVMKAKEPTMASDKSKMNDMAEDEMEEEVDFEAMFKKMSDERDMYKTKYEEMMKADPEPEDEGSEESLVKSLPDAVRQMLNKARDEAKSVREELRKEVDARNDREYVAKAASWGNLSINPSDVGPALRKMAEYDADLASSVMSALGSANAQAEAANIFAELGTTARPDSGDAYGRMTKMAKAAVANGDHATVEQAISALVISNPEMYEAYRQESNK